MPGKPTSAARSNQWEVICNVWLVAAITQKKEPFSVLTVEHLFGDVSVAAPAAALAWETNACTTPWYRWFQRGWGWRFVPIDHAGRHIVPWRVVRREGTLRKIQKEKASCQRSVPSGGVGLKRDAAFLVAPTPRATLMGTECGGRVRMIFPQACGRTLLGAVWRTTASMHILW